MEMPSKEVLLKLYRELLTARLGEQRMFEIVGSAIVPTGHRGPGEEVIPIAICNNLTETDCFQPNFRTCFCSSSCHLNSQADQSYIRTLPHNS